MHKTVALGRVVPPKRHLKLENVLLQVIVLEHGVLKLIRRAFVMMPVIFTMYESLLYECVNFPENFLL